MFRFLLLLSFFNLACKKNTSSQTNIKQNNSLFVQTIEFRNQLFDIVKVDLRKHKIRMAYKDEVGKAFRNFKSLKTSYPNLQFAMNGGMYLKDGRSQGLYIEEGKTIAPTDTVQDAYGNFYLQPNGIFYLQKDKGAVLTTSQFLQSNLQVDYATQSGPMLVIDGSIHPVFREGSSNLHIRNGVGMVSEQEIVFAISHKKVNLFDFAMLFKEQLKCDNALYLDGFVSKAYIPELGREEMEGNFGVMIYVR